MIYCPNHDSFECEMGAISNYTGQQAHIETIPVKRACEVPQVGARHSGLKSQHHLEEAVAFSELLSSPSLGFLTSISDCKA